MLIVEAKIFRILAERYRNRRRRFGLRCNLIAALYNYECSQAAWFNLQDVTDELVEELVWSTEGKTVQRATIAFKSS